MSGLKTTIGGKATVHCVHDREKRVVTDPEHVRFLGRVAGVQYDPTLHKLQRCACCENLFVTVDDTPTLCHGCVRPPEHQLQAPIPEPLEGAI